jgi:hypothetical protein
MLPMLLATRGCTVALSSESSFQMLESTISYLQSAPTPV